MHQQGQTRALVLQTIRYNDFSLIVKMFTREAGLLSFMVKGTHGKKSKFKPAYFQPLTVLEVQYTQKTGSDLYQLREVMLGISLESSRTDAHKIAVSLFLAEFFSKSLREQHADENLFTYLESRVLELEHQPRCHPAFHIKVLLELTGYLGFFPLHNRDVYNKYFSLLQGNFESIPNTGHHLDEATSEALCAMLDTDEMPVMTGDMRNALLTGLIQYYRFHIPAFPEIKSLEVLQAVYQ